MKRKFWNKSIAISIASKYGIKLNYIHWKIIYYFRFFYFKNGNIPNIRNLIIFLNKNVYFNNYKFDSLFLYKLFPGGLIKQVTSIACIPSFVQCF